MQCSAYMGTLLVCPPPPSATVPNAHFFHNYNIVFDVVDAPLPPLSRGELSLEVDIDRGDYSWSRGAVYTTCVQTVALLSIILF